MRRNLFILVLPLVFAGCTAPHAVKERDKYTPQSDAFVLLNSSPWDSRFRSELSKRGFKILKSPAQNAVISKGRESEASRSADVAEARYGLALNWVTLDHCVENNSKVIDATLEVSYIKSNEVILVIKKSGFTGPCGPPRAVVFEELVNSLADDFRHK